MAEETDTKATLPPTTETAQEQTTGTQPPIGEEAKYTDKQLNDLIAKESGKREAKAQADLLSKMGFTSLDDVEKFAAERNASMSEADKTKARLAEIENESKNTAKERDEAKAEIAALKAGISPDKVEKVVRLAAGYDGDTPAERITALLADFPDIGKVSGQSQDAGKNLGMLSGQKRLGEVERLLEVARKQAGLTK